MSLICNGKGIEIHRNDEESNDVEEKFNIFVQSDLYSLIVGNIKEDDPDGNWEEADAADTKVLGYTVTSSGEVSLSNADTGCAN